MLFGRELHPATTVAASTDWIEPLLAGAGGTVGGLVPNQYESYLRIFAPDTDPEPIDGDWWSTYRQLFEVVASIGAEHTSSPQHAFYAIWEGHGFDSILRSVAWKQEPIDASERLAREQERARVRSEGHRQAAAIRTKLARWPSFDLPNRTHYLFEGSVTAVANVRHPGSDSWCNPDLFWPDDQRWFVATDVDIWSLYVGGTRQLISELAQSVPTRAEPIGLDAMIEMEH